MIKMTEAWNSAAACCVALALLAVMATPGQAQTINEIRIDQPGWDNDEYVEIKGTPLSGLEGLTYVVIGDLPGDPNDNSGVIEAVVELSGQNIPASGYMVVAESTYTLGTADVVTALNFENSDTVTHLLVEEFTGSIGQDLDIDDDGILDVTPWADIIDEVALVEDDPPVDPDDEYPYSSIKVGPDGTNVPGHVYRCADGSGTWQIGAFATGVDDTPGATNYCGPPLGACCVGLVCNVTTEAGCAGTWEEHVSCDPLPCGPTGSCCEPDYFCTDGLTEPECTFQDPLAGWLEGGTCVADCIAPLGSCCLPDGTCMTGYTEVQCLSEDGYQWTDGAPSCKPPCLLTPAPVIISEYYESAPGSRKALEIYNTSPDPQSLNGHRLALYSNENTSPTGTYLLNGITMPGHSVLVFINNVDDDIPSFDENSAIVAPSVCLFNGDDAVKILFGDPALPAVVDAFAIQGQQDDGPRGVNPYADAAWKRDDAVLVGTDDFDSCNFDGEIGCTVGPCPPGTPVACTPGAQAGEWVFEGLNPSGDNGNHSLGWHALALPTGACCVDTVCTPQMTEAACGGAGGVYQGNGTACLPHNPCVPATGACCIGESCSIVEGAGNCTGTYVGDYSECDPNPCLPQTLIISEVADGTFPNGEPKFIEITNAGGVLVALDDYRIALYSNGSLTENANSMAYGDLAGYAIAPGGSFVIANSNSGPGDSFFAIFSVEADSYDAVANSNGDDVYELLKDAGGGNDLLVDVHGEKGVDGTGTAWEYLDSYANRRAGITSGNQTFTLAEWCHPGVDVLEGPNGNTSDDEELLMQMLLTPGVHGGGDLGTCCVGGTCTQETEAGCGVLGGIYGGDCTVCSPNPCGGACCVAPDDCRIETEAGCASLGGGFLGLGSECSPNPCGGACCDGAICTIETAENCLLVIGGDYKGDGVECSPVSPCEGACCVGPACSVETADGCAALEGTYIGDGTDCTVSPCECVTEAGAEPPNLPVPSGVVLCEMVISSTTDLINSSTYKNFHAQDATGGITVFGTVAKIDELLNGPDGLPGTGDEVGVGDSIKISGTTDEYNGLFELAEPPPPPPVVGLPLAVLEKIGSPGIPDPIVVSLSDFQVSSPTAEGLESMLVDLQGVWFIDGGMQFTYGNWTVTDDSGLTATVRVATESLDLIGQVIPTGTVNVAGLFSQFDTTDPRDGGYQLMPRSISDVVEVVTDCGTCLGDVDAVIGDGTVDTGDIVGMVEALLGLTSRPCADVNDDTLIDGRDVEAFIGLVLANAGAGTPCVTGPLARDIEQCFWYTNPSTCDDGDTNGWCIYEVLDSVVPGGVTQCVVPVIGPLYPNDLICVPCNVQCDPQWTVQTFRWIDADGMGNDCYFEAWVFQATPPCGSSCGQGLSFNDFP